METCPIDLVGFKIFDDVVKMIGGKWKLSIIFTLASNRKMRYGELKKEIPNISHKMLSSQLKELEKDGLVERKDFKEIPPRVEYTLSTKGEDLKPVMGALCGWIVKYTKN